MSSEDLSDTIRVLIATDNHVGYNERDPIRGNDSARTFDEIMRLASERDVDMVLLGGDLFHDNKPSRKAMYDVMKSLRQYTLGDKPCELELMSDEAEFSTKSFNHANYLDPNINVAIPVFSIHGNHDDPSGEGHFCALDILQVSGLINYFGRTPEADNINIKPILLRKGETKLALYGMSNVRDERLYRTFRDYKVKFFRPEDDQNTYFHLMALHQNHHAHTETGYIPENFLPSFLDFVLWGHEHECVIDPIKNAEMGFHVLQPGSSVATSLCQGEAVEKQVTIMSITVRPFIMKEIILAEERGMAAIAKKKDNRAEVTRYLTKLVEELIQEAQADWIDAQEDDYSEIPLPLIRLRVDYSTTEGSFEVENPQRFSNRFVGKVANVNDVVQFHRKRTNTARAKTNGTGISDTAMANVTIDNIRIEKLVRDFLSSQTLTVLPQNHFGDAVRQYVDKDEKHAVETFVNDSLSNQLKHLMGNGELAEDEIDTAMAEHRAKLEELFASGHIKRKRPTRLKPKPDGWDSDLDGEWEAQPAAQIFSDVEDNSAGAQSMRVSPPPAARGGRGRGRGRSGTARTTKSASTSSSFEPKRALHKRAPVEEEEDEDEDIVMVDDSEDEVKPAPVSRTRRATARAVAPKSAPKSAPKAKAPAKKAATKQATLFFSQSQSSNTNSQSFGSTGLRNAPRQTTLPEDDIDDESDAFEPI